MKKFLSFFLSFVNIACFAIPQVNDLTTEEKVGQLLMFFFQGEAANAEAKALIEKVHVGGIIYYNWANDLTSPLQVQKLSNKLQKYARQTRLSIPLFISVDQEGGVVTRLQNGFTVFPGNGALGITQDIELTMQSAFATGTELRAVGINMNLAPVADIEQNPEHPVIGIRSFGDSPLLVSNLCGAALQGYQQANVIATLKHFPGYGSANCDPHHSLPVVNKTKSQLLVEDLLPFKTLVQQADAIMSAHLKVPALDPDKCATLSEKILIDLLRNQWQYDGVVISDSLVMEGIDDHSEALHSIAVKAFLAGNDILLFGGRSLHNSKKKELQLKDMISIHQYLVDAVNHNQIPMDRLNTSVERILKLKEKYGLYTDTIPTKKTIDQNVFTPIHQAIAEKIAHRSVRMLQFPQALAHKPKVVTVLAPSVLKGNLDKSLIKELGKEVKLFFYEGTDSKEKSCGKEIAAANKSDLVICFTYDAWKHVKQRKIIDGLIQNKKDLIVIATANPQDANVFPTTNAFATYSPAPESLKEVCRLIQSLINK